MNTILSRHVAALAVMVLLLTAQSQGQERTEGPIVNGFGGVYAVEGLDYPTPTDHHYRVVFEVAVGAPSQDSVNSRINTVARFLNMHAQAGVPLANMELALVLHGTAGKDALHNEAYRRRFGVDNPNLPLLEGLKRSGVDIYLCGQTAMHRGLERNELSNTVKVALSAMTVLVTLQADGYTAIAL